jgi:hypothetical protein
LLQFIALRDTLAIATLGQSTQRSLTDVSGFSAVPLCSIGSWLLLAPLRFLAHRINLIEQLLFLTSFSAVIGELIERFCTPVFF